jgi:hypothetical protein
VQTPHAWIWQQPDWPRFRWDEARVSLPLARARLAQGKVLGAARLLDANLSLEAVASPSATPSAVAGPPVPFFRLLYRARLPGVSSSAGVPGGCPASTCRASSAMRLRYSSYSMALRSAGTTPGPGP